MEAANDDHVADVGKMIGQLVQKMHGFAFLPVYRLGEVPLMPVLPIGEEA